MTSRDRSAHGRRRAIIIGSAATLAGALLAVGAYDIVPAKFQATGALLMGAYSGDPDRYIADQIAIATGPALIANVAREVGQTRAEVDQELVLTQVRLSNVVEFSATAPTQAQAIRIADAAQQAYIQSPVRAAQRAPNNGTTVILQNPVATGRAGLTLQVDVGIGAITGLFAGVLIALGTASRRRSPRSRRDEDEDA